MSSSSSSLEREIEEC